MYGIVYKAENIITDKMYVGATTKSLEQRKAQHIWSSKNGRGKKFAVALQKWGLDNFKWEILEKCKGRMELTLAESRWIDKLDTVDSGYNLCYKSNIPSEEIKKKMSESRKGYKYTEETRKKISEANMGHKVSLETRKKISEANMGHKVSSETRKKISKNLTGNKNSLGYKHTEEAKKKISEAKMGHKGSLGYKHTEEAKKKISEAKMGHKILLRTRRKYQKVRWGVI